MNLTWEQETIRARDATPIQAVRELSGPKHISVIDPLVNAETSDEEPGLTALLSQDLSCCNLLLIDAAAHPGDTGKWHSWPYYAKEIRRRSTSLDHPEDRQRYVGAGSCTGRHQLAAQ